MTPQPHLPGGAEDVLSARGSLTRKEYWQQRKSPQIRWMAERVGVMVKNGVRHVVDIGTVRERADVEWALCVFLRVLLMTPLHRWR